MDFSRRMLIGAAAAAPAVAALAKEAAPASAPLFGPPASEAHLLFNENPYGPAPSALRAISEWASAGCYYPDAANARLSRPEQVKKWRLLPAEWTAESAELTPTLKLKRRVVHTNYADVIDELYAE